MNRKATGPMSWNRAELLAWDGWQLKLNAGQLDELSTVARRAIESEVPLEQLTQADFPLSNLGPQLAGVSEELENGCGLVILRSLPVGAMSEPESTAMFWALASHLGTAVPQTVNGAKLFHVRDEGYADNHPQARGPSSRRRLSFHTDRCDVIAFCCLRQAHSGGENHVLCARRLFDSIRARRPDLAETLQEPFFYQRHNVDPANQSAYYQQPVFSFFEGHFTGQLLRVLIDRAYASGDVPAMTERQREALDLLESTADDPSLYVSFRQDEGDIVLMNNLTTFHRRTEFEDHSEPELRRHLLRIWLATPNSRPLDPLFEASYGSTRPGAIRGGMRTAL